MAYVEPPQSGSEIIDPLGPNSLQLRARRLVRCKHRLGGLGSNRNSLNGKDGPGIGNPQSRGNATWFILPGQLKEVILSE